MVTWRASPLLVVARVGSAAAIPPEMCKPAGAVVLEVDQLADAPAKLATATWLYENGSWKPEVYDAHHKLVRWSTGCTGTAELDTFNAGVRDASWKATRPRESSFATHGAVPYTTRMRAPKKRERKTENDRMALRGADREAFLAAIAERPRPSARLVAALRKHRWLVG